MENTITCTFYNFNIDIKQNILEAFIRTVDTGIKYKINIILPHYYLIPKDEEIKIYGEYDIVEYNDFTLLLSNNHTVEVLDIDDLKNIRKTQKQDLKLIIAENYCHKLKEYAYNTMFINSQWFFVLRDMKLNETYEIKTNIFNKLIEENTISAKSFDKIFNKKVDYIPVDLHILAFDIECYIPENGKFPDGYNSSISHISVVYKGRRSDSVGRYVFYNTENPYKPNVDLHTDKFIEAHKNKNCEYILGTEKEILIKFIELYHTLDKDIVVTYNGGSFDFKFINTRCMNYKIKGMGVELDNMEIKKKKIIENTNLLDYIYLDLMNYALKTFDNMLDSFSLDSVSNYLLNCYVSDYELISNESDKTLVLYLDSPETYFINILDTAGFIAIEDESYKIISLEQTSASYVLKLEIQESTKLPSIVKDKKKKKFRINIGKDDVDLLEMYKNYNAEMCLLIGLYNLHDSALLIAIIESLSLVDVIKAASDISYIPQSLVLKRYNGSQIKGLALKISLENKIVIIDDKEHGILDKFIGANVMVPKHKFIENPIICLDINSLYPNNIIWGNMSPEKLIGVFRCFDVIVLNSSYEKLCKLYPFPDYFVIKINEEAELPTYQIAVFDRRESGLIPKMLLYLLGERKKVNKEIESRIKLNKDFESTDEFRRLDALQLQFKIRANSLYGLLGSEFFFIEGRIIGEACTALGRKIIRYVDQCVNGMEVCEDGIVYFDYNIEPPINIPSKKIEFKLIEDLDNKVLIKLASQYIDTDSNQVICEPINNKAKSYLEISEEEYEEFKDLSNEQINDKCQKILDDKFDEYLKILLKIGTVVCNFINENILFDNIQTKFENILFQAIYRSSKQYSGKVISIDNPLKIKEKYSGTILRKRSYALIHKTVISSINKNIENKLKYRTKITKEFLDGMLDKVVEIYFLCFTANQIDINDYKFSRKFNSSYKNPENHNLEIVKEYNSHVAKQNQISVGSRYNYIFITDNTQQRYAKLPSGKTNYEFIVTDHKIINGHLVNNSIKRLDETKTYRIFYEIYFERIIGDIVRLYYNTPSFNKALNVYKYLFTKSFDEKSLKI